MPTMTAWRSASTRRCSNAGDAGKVAVVGTDGIREAKKSVADGAMRATVAEFPLEEGQLGVDVALRLLDCQADPALGHLAQRRADEGQRRPIY